MKRYNKNLIILFICLICNIIYCNAQTANYDIEYETHKVGVFNPEWEITHTLNPIKYEHITGFFREELAKTIIDAVKNKKIKIYDNRKRELNVDSVANQIIKFEKSKFNHIVGKDSVWDYIIPFIGAYDFEEAITYHFDNLMIEKKTISYCPYIVRYKHFDDDNNDSVQMPLFWIFPKDTVNQYNLKNKQTFQPEYLSIPDTVLSVLTLKYPVKMPFTRNIFDLVQSKKLNVQKSDGTNFKASKELDDLFVIHRTATIELDDPVRDSVIDTYSDIIPEDITAIRIAENWQIRKDNLDIIKTVNYFLPLYPYGEKTYSQLGFRVWNPKIH